MKPLKRTRARHFAGAVSVLLVLGLIAFAGLGASGTLTPAAAQYAPANQSPPTISGTAQQDSTLTATTGAWQGDVQKYAYQWQRCDKNGNNCKNISGATKNSYKLTSGDVGSRARVVVTASNADGSASATSALTQVVAAPSGGGGGGTPPPSGTCSGSGPINVADFSPPIRLLVDKWQFTPNVVNLSTRTIVARIHISDTCNRSVIGALVWATAIPYNQVSTTQATTGGDGYVTLNFTVGRGFPANPGRQQIMAMLVRATDPKGSVLAGKSTRRVLSLAVNAH